MGYRGGAWTTHRRNRAGRQAGASADATAGDNMNEQMLRQELEKVSHRFRRLLLWSALALSWLVLALAGLAVLAWARGASHAVPGIALLLLLVLPIVALPMLFKLLAKVQDP